MPTTPKGTPYVDPTDHPVDYPPVSKALADHIDGLADHAATKAYVDARTPKIISGGVDCPAVGAPHRITFPPGFFTATPVVTVSADRAEDRRATVYGRTKDGADVYTWGPGGSFVLWTAIGT